MVILILSNSTKIKTITERAMLSTLRFQRVIQCKLNISEIFHHSMASPQLISPQHPLFFSLLSPLSHSEDALMWVFVKLGVGKSQAEWENAACMNGHRLAPAYRRSTGTCVVAHSLATPGNCNCVCILYLCISQFFSCCICYFTLCGLAVSGQVVEAPAGRKQLTVHPNPVLLRRRRGKHTEYLENFN